ncbi:MAG: terminase small subunit [Acutalibacteraceae bacterium]
MNCKKHNGLTRKEQLFCYSYINTGNARESAVRAGYSRNPELAGESLLCRDDIINELERLRSKCNKAYSPDAASGYRRLAFGSIADAVMLLYTDCPDKEQLESMDLFNIAEIKRPKDGAMEIKFFDRVRALEHLEQAESCDESSAVPFYRALEQGARAIKKTCDTEDYQ